MAVPSFVTASTGSTDAMGAWSHTANAPAAAGNILIVHLLQDGTNASAPSITSVTNAEALNGTDNTLTYINSSATSYPVGSPAVAYQHLWIGRALNTSAMVITGANAGNDDVYVRVYEFSDVNTGTTLASVIENSTAGSTTNTAATNGTITDAGVTALGPDRRALNFIGINDDNALAAFTGMSGGTWTEAIGEYAEANGTDATIGLQVSRIYTLEYLDNGASEYGFGDPIQQLAAQSFVAPSTASSWRVAARLRKQGSPADSVVLEIRTDNSGVPSSTVLGSASLTLDRAAHSVYSATISASLTASTTYWIVASRSGSLDASNYYTWRQSFTAYAGGVGANYTGTWNTGTDTAFGVRESSSLTIDGGTTTNADATDGWGVVGFALLGTPAGSTPIDRELKYLQAVNRASLW